MSDLTLKRIMELWEGIPVIYTITSTGEWNTYHVNVRVRDEAKVNPDLVYFEGNYIIKSQGGQL